MDHERFQASLRELGVLYSKTKKYVLKAEQVDPESRSNIAIFKEQRDALDHVMRALWEYFEKGDERDETNLLGQIENARGHMFRAAYDALDGAGVSYKFRIESAMRGISNDAISAVYPNYYDHVVEINNLDHKIAAHRERKDEQRRSMQDLDDYCASIDRLSELSNAVIAKTPAFQQWEKRNREKNIIWAISVPVALVLLGVLLTLAGERYFNRAEPERKSSTTSSLPSPAVSPAPSQPSASPSASP